MGTSPYDDGWLAGIELEARPTGATGELTTGTITFTNTWPERPTCIVKSTDGEIDTAAAARVRAFLGPSQHTQKR